MRDELELLVGSIESEGPSPDFVARLRAQIVDETSTTTNTLDADGVVEIELLPVVEEEPGRGRWVALAAAAAIVVVVGLVALLSGGDDGALDVNFADEPAFLADAPLLTEADLVIDPGTYRVDTLGTPFTFEVGEPQVVQVNDRAMVVFTDPTSQGATDRDLVVTRLSVLADPAQPLTPLEAPIDGWAAADFAGWLDQLGEEILISNRAEVRVGGRAATRMDLELGTTDCVVGSAFCLALGTSSSAAQVDLQPGILYRLWFVGQGEEDPVVILAAIGREADRTWFETVDDVLATLAFGEVSPNPVVDVSVGPVELPFLGGVRFALADGSFVMRTPAFDRVILGDWTAYTEFLANPGDSDGTPLESAEAVLSVLGSSDTAVVTAVGPAEADGVEAQVFDIASTGSAAVLRGASAEGAGWHPPVRGRMWLIEHPDRGLLMITAEASENVDIEFALALAHTEAIIESLEFIESGG